MILQNYDFIAIEEVRDLRVLDRLTQLCTNYSYIASPQVGGGVKEIYAFFYRKDIVQPIGTACLLKDTSNYFIREPFIGTFKIGNFDFTICAIHLLFGDSAKTRRKELVLMRKVVAAIQKANYKEDDVILVGDFNFPYNDVGWQMGDYIPLFTGKTTIGNKSAFDNMWINEKYTREFEGSTRIYKYDHDEYNDDINAAYKACSDHRPISAKFYIDLLDDDINDYGNLQNIEVK